MPIVIVLYIALAPGLLYGQAPQFPWGPQVRCNLNPARPKGLHPDALSALRELALAHRITQGFNGSPGRGNVHYADGTIDGEPFTAAVDISVRCLSESQIREMLSRLAAEGFAGWYRKDGADDWTGPPHIHAIWAGVPLKPVLRRQVESWLAGLNGLGPNRPYQFWQPSEATKEPVQKLFNRSR